MTEVNVPLLRKILEHITANPKEWDQGVWGRKDSSEESCGTAFCVAGHALALSGYAFSWRWHGGHQQWEVTGAGQFGDDPGLGAADLLGLNELQAQTLFNPDNNLRAVWEWASSMSNGEIQVPVEIVEKNPDAYWDRFPGAIFQ